jgi:hypothetical protein
MREASSISPSTPVSAVNINIIFKPLYFHRKIQKEKDGSEEPPFSNQL